jgi:hypothetical protein
MQKDFTSVFETGTGAAVGGPGGFGGLILPLLLIVVVAAAGIATLMILKKRRRAKAPALVAPMQGVPQHLPCPVCGVQTPLGGARCQSCGANLSSPPPGWGPPGTG